MGCRYRAQVTLREGAVPALRLKLIVVAVVIRVVAKLSRGGCGCSGYSGMNALTGGERMGVRCGRAELARLIEVAKVIVE